MSNVHKEGSKWNILFGITAWQIWKDRCDLIFNNHITMSGNLSIIISNYATEVTKNLSLMDNILSSPLNDNPETWSKPAFGVWKLNTDGSFRHQNSTSACGGLIRDWNGSLIRGFCCKIAEGNPLKTELVGVLKGLEVVQDLQPKDLEIEVDSKVAVELITINCPRDHHCYRIVERIHNLASRLVKVTFHNINRKANMSADKLANMGHQAQNLVFNGENAPPWLFPMLRNDARVSSSC